MSDFLPPIFGGLLIGLAAIVLLLFSGRIAGISGIFWGAISFPNKLLWRGLFLIGILAGAWLFHFISKQPIPSADGSALQAVIAGLLVGFGTKLGSGCTSGHGVCGIGRLSPRSLISTCTFMVAGITTVFIIRHIFP